MTVVVLQNAAQGIVALHGWNLGIASGGSAVQQVPATFLGRSGKIDHQPREHLAWSVPGETSAP